MCRDMIKIQQQSISPVNSIVLNELRIMCVCACVCEAFRSNWQTIEMIKSIVITQSHAHKTTANHLTV